MPIKDTSAQAPSPQGVIQARSHQVAVIDHLGNKHTFETNGALLVMDPALAVQCEVGQMDYVWVNPAQVAVLIVEGVPVPAAPLLLGPPLPTAEVRPSARSMAELVNGVGSEDAPA